MNRKELLELGFKRMEKLTVQNSEYLKWVKIYTVKALKQDVGKRGDITTRAVVDEYKGLAKAVVVVKEEGIVAGIEEAKWFYQQYNIRVKALKKDGEPVKRGEIVLELEGLVGDLLKTERSGLKPLQRMSGIATMTQKLTNKIREQGYDTMVAATRKTDWQLLDKKAVCLGGGLTHRLSLHESILIKDNHLEELKRQGFTKNYIEEALDRAWKYKDEAVFIEIEVTTKQEAIRAAKKFRELQRNLKNQKPCVIMFDNMASDEIKDTIEELKKRGLYNYVLFEASGGIKEDNILEYAKVGCDVLSLGALTHSSKALDISQEIILEGRSACLRRSRK